MLEQVKEFMQLMGQDTPDKPAIPQQAIQQLRFGLIDEENKELADAAATGDLVEVADALCDLLYVVAGACIAYGFSPELIDKMFAEVQRSNMSKICSSEKETMDTASKYMKDGIQVSILPVKDKWAVVRASDGKALKSINWSEPDLKSILHG